MESDEGVSGGQRGRELPAVEPLTLPQQEKEMAEGRKQEKATVVENVSR